MRPKSIFITCAITVLLTAACDLANLPFLAPNPTATIDQQALVDQAISATNAANTQIAEAVQLTLAAMVSDTPVDTPTPTFTLTPSLTFTPTPTLTPTFTITRTPTNTVSTPMVTVSAETNCRSGPGLAYELLGVLYPGETAKVIGKTNVANYWLILNPDSPTQVCWLWGQYATVTGDWQSLPVATQPPTPTPAPGFMVKYLGVVTCTSNYALRLEITNIGPITFRSIKVDMTDAEAGVTKTHYGDNFADYTGCLATTSWIDLEPNEVGISVTTNPGSFAYNITGHNLTVTITLFTLDGLAGDSVTKTLSITP